MARRFRRLGRFSAGLVVLALSLALWPTGVAFASARPAVTCTSTAPVFHRIPVLGDRFGEISDYNFSYCLPREDSVRLVTDEAVRDADGRAWFRVALDGATYGRRVGWVPGDYLARTDLPPGARVSAGADQ